jgi:hypothetical protein
MENPESLSPSPASQETSSLTQKDYKERWNKEILPRKEELLKRFPDFVPSFSLQRTGEDLEYSFHLTPVTEKGMEIKEHLPNFFPVIQEFRPIEMMWREDTGTNEIDMFLNLFPSQVAIEKQVKERKRQAKRKEKIEEARTLFFKIGILTIIVASMNILGNTAERSNSSVPNMCERSNQNPGLQK